MSCALRYIMISYTSHTLTLMSSAIVVTMIQSRIPVSDIATRVHFKVHWKVYSILGCTTIFQTSPIPGEPAEKDKSFEITLSKLHALFWEWDTVKFLISMSHNFSSDFDINVPTLVPLTYMSPKIMNYCTYFNYIHFYCDLASFYMNTILIPSNSKEPFFFPFKFYVASLNWCPIWLGILISSVPIDPPEFWYRPMVTVPLSL